MDMSKAIREGRDRLGMSQEALAERLGVEKWFVICGIGIIIVALAVFLLPGLREIDNTQ